MLSHSETIKEIRTAARNAGLTFKPMESIKINGRTAYKFIARDTGELVLSNCTLGSAYDNVCSGFISSWNGEMFNK